MIQYPSPVINPSKITTKINNIINMEKELKNLMVIYNQYKTTKYVPLKFEQKVNLLVSLLNDQEISLEQYIEVPLKDVESFTQMTHFQQFTTLSNLINGLTGREQSTFFRQQFCYFKKDAFFSSWTETFIQSDFKYIHFYKAQKGKKKQLLISLKLSDIGISQNFKQYGKKIGFTITCENTLYYVGFENLGLCERIHYGLQQLLYEGIEVEKKETKIQEERQQLLIKNIIQGTIPSPTVRNSSNSSNVVNRTVDSTLSQASRSAKNKQKQQIQELVVFLKSQLEVQEQFKLYKNFKNGQLLISRNKPNRVKIIALLHSENSEMIAQYLSEETKWNPIVYQENVISKTGFNSYIFSKKLQQYNLISWPRELLFNRKVFQYEDTTYILDMNYQIDEPDSNYIQAQYNAMISITRRDQNLWFMSMISQIDNKGYCTAKDNQNMILKYFENLEHLQTYISSKLFSTIKKNLFEFEQKNIRSSSFINSVQSLRKNESLIEDQLTDRISTHSEPKSAYRKKLKVVHFEQQKIQQISRNQVDHRKKTHSEKDENQKKQQQEQLLKDIDIQQEPSFCNLMPESVKSYITQDYLSLLNKKENQRYYLDIEKIDTKENKQSKNFLQAEQNFIFRSGDWKLNAEQQMVFINQKVLDAQSSVLSYIVKQIGSNIFSGKSIMNMSLPVDIFSNVSLLETIANAFGYVPKYLKQAAKTNDLLEQMKQVTLLLTSFPMLSLNVQKPFNPILGQTFQCFVEDIPIYFQQTCHHPPISSFLIKTKQFMMYGNFRSNAQMGLNSAVGSNLNSIHILFLNTGAHFHLLEPQFEISGLVYGQRKFKVISKALIFQQNSNLYTEILFGTNRNSAFQMKQSLKASSLHGIICKTKADFSKKFFNMIQKEKKSKYASISTNQIEEKLVQISGQWIGNINFNGMCVRDINKDFPYLVQYNKAPLPSDSNFRLDILYRRLGVNAKSQEQKEKLQNLQRSDRKLRENKK